MAMDDPPCEPAHADIPPIEDRLRSARTRLQCLPPAPMPGRPAFPSRLCGCPKHRRLLRVWLLIANKLLAVSVFIRNICIMRGRPKRRAHDDLIHLLQEERRRAGASLRTVAKLMDVDASTLSRSIAQQALSADMAERARKLLKAGIPSGEAAMGEKHSTPDRIASLLILRKFTDMMPEVEGALRAALGMPTAVSRRDG